MRGNEDHMRLNRTAWAMFRTVVESGNSITLDELVKTMKDQEHIALDYDLFAQVYSARILNLRVFDFDYEYKYLIVRLDKQVPVNAGLDAVSVLSKSSPLHEECVSEEVFLQDRHNAWRNRREKYPRRITLSSPPFSPR